MFKKLKKFDGVAIDWSDSSFAVVYIGEYDSCCRIFVPVTEFSLSMKALMFHFHYRIFAVTATQMSKKYEINN